MEDALITIQKNKWWAVPSKVDGALWLEKLHDIFFCDCQW